MEVYFIAYKHRNSGNSHIKTFKSYKDYQKRLNEILQKKQYEIISTGSRN